MHRSYLTTNRRLAAGIIYATFTAAAFAQVASSPASSSAETTDDDTLVMEAFVTTGSNIQRLDAETSLPVTLFDNTQIEARDAETSMDLLAGIPQVTNFPKNETSVNSVASRGGNAAAALRGVGQSNTLVLLNGRRVPFNPVSSLSPADSTVNINALPSVGLQQVEVLRDGASAIYGADAVAGVINYISDVNLYGGTATVRFGATEHGGGMSSQGTISYGTVFAGGKGRWVSTANIFNRDAIYLREREISASTERLDRARPPFDTVGGAYDGRSNTTEWPSFKLGADTVSGTTYRFYPINGTPQITTAGLPRDLYLNYNEDSIGQPFSTRGSVFSRVEYDISPKLTAFGEVLGYMTKSKTGRQPISLRSSDARVTLSVDNPYNPFGSAFYEPGGAGGTKVDGDPTAITIATKLLTDGGGERVEATDRMYRILGGLKGQFGESTWSWESAAMLGGYRITDRAINSVRESLIQIAGLRTTPDAYNPFGYTFKVVDGAVAADQPYENPAEVIDYYTQSANRIGHSRLASVDARATGQLIDLWAGPISTSVGLEWRYDEKVDYKDPYVGTNPEDDPTVTQGNNDILVMSPKYNYKASRTVASAYAEGVVPLVSPDSDLPLLDSLEATASIRFERYSDFGNATKPKFGLNWKPVDWVMVRASYNEGFHAPDLTDMNQPTSFTVASPPGTRDDVRNNYFLGAGLAADQQVLTRSYSAPNPDLEPEESEGLSAGVVVQVPQVKGLSFSVDYWEITQENLVLRKTRDTGADEALLRAYTQQQLAAGVDIMDIDVGSHLTPDSTDTYVGDANTLRAAPNSDDYARFAATYASLPQSEWIAPLGQWIGSTNQLINGTGNAFTNGFDYQVDYSLPRTEWGQFRFTSTWSMFLNKFQKETPDDPKDDDIIAMLLPEWKSSTTLMWHKNAWTASVSATYESEMRTNATTNQTGYEGAGSPDYIKVVFNNGQTYYYERGSSQLQINLGLSYRFADESESWLSGTRVRLGVNNVLDDEPSLYNPHRTGYTGGTGSALWIGRAYSLTLSRAF
ncbi:TonB-dependent receptor plug domain-containing protein [Synoicihabitans lomoniglobus]|uniref:TonB-dependent receptor n=1 Tax=Synoicihabitans lomoniglobus TaxID=2909285 RepID=A0AAF0CQ65_9BACT|nr:TonB-dependent receptor [Opitutaceae bacterium LMO-M01]WED66007.1 TonB-dependent receptor [Opitutaceae bacterium LMO-M01]